MLHDPLSIFTPRRGQPHQVTHGRGESLARGEEGSTSAELSTSRVPERRV